MTRPWKIYAISRAGRVVYVGQTVQPVMKRFRQHCGDVRSGTLISKALRKYGPDAFTVDTLLTCRTQEDANLSEVVLLAQYNTLYPHGYNLLVGGDNHERVVCRKGHKLTPENRTVEGNCKICSQERNLRKREMAKARDIVAYKAKQAENARNWRKSEKGQEAKKTRTRKPYTPEQLVRKAETAKLRYTNEVNTRYQQRYRHKKREVARLIKITQACFDAWLAA